LTKKFISIGEKHPELIDEYSPNNEIPISEVSYGSEKPRKWICKLILPIHEYEMTPYARRRGRSCNQKQCIDKKRAKTVRKKSVERSISFSDKYPDRVKQWHKDNDESPHNVSIHSHYEAKLICERGHTWIRTIQQHITSPHCSKCKKIRIWGSAENYEKFLHTLESSSLSYHQTRWIFKKEDTKKQHMQIKYLVFEYYSRTQSDSEIPCCSCCGENSFLDFLSIDHIKPLRRKTNTGISGMDLYKQIIKKNFSDIYQVLCHNCNHSKRDNDYCEHQKDSLK